jgi:hypothetical protein
MQETDKNSFHELMLGAGELYGKEITKPLLRIYFNALEDLTMEQVTHAFSAHIKSTDQAGTFFPKPADLIRQITGAVKEQQQLVEDRAEMAWACIEREISRIGSYGTLELDDKQAIAAVKAIGGWRALCMCTYDQLVWKKKEFFSSYDCYERTDLSALPSKLPGLIELSEHKAESQQGVKSLMDGLNEYRNRKGIEQE